MNNSELNAFIKILRLYKKKSASKQKSKEFLVNAGILTEKGNLRKKYKDLCILQEQA